MDFWQCWWSNQLWKCSDKTVSFKKQISKNWSARNCFKKVLFEKLQSEILKLISILCKEFVPLIEVTYVYATYLWFAWYYDWFLLSKGKKECKKLSITHELRKISLDWKLPKFHEKLNSYLHTYFKLSSWFVLFKKFFKQILALNFNA